LAKLEIPLNLYDLNEERTPGSQTSTNIRKEITPQTRGIVLINPNNPTALSIRGANWKRLRSWRGN